MATKAIVVLVNFDFVQVFEQYVQCKSLSVEFWLCSLAPPFKLELDDEKLKSNGLARLLK